MTLMYKTVINRMVRVILRRFWLAKSVFGWTTCAVRSLPLIRLIVMLYYVLELKTDVALSSKASEVSLTREEWPAAVS